MNDSEWMTRRDSRGRLWASKAYQPPPTARTNWRGIGFVLIALLALIAWVAL